MFGKPEFEPPNGGIRAWIVVFGSFLLQMSSFGYINACGIFQFYYQVVLLPNKSTSQIAWIITLQVFLLFFLGPPIGRLVDKFGPRRVIAPFAALGVISLGLLSLCKTYWQIMLCQGLGFGFACAGTTLPAVVTVSQWFSTRRGLAVGIASCGSSFGGVIFPIMVSTIVEEKGFAVAARWSALVIGCGMVIGVLCCDSPPALKELQARRKAAAISTNTEAHVSRDSELQAHFKAPTSAENEVMDSDVEKASDAGIRTPPMQEEISAQEGPAKRSKLAGLGHNGVPWAFFVLGGFFAMCSILAPFNYLPEMAVANGMSIHLARYSISIASAGSMFGRVVPGWASDKFGQFNMMVLVTAGSAISILAIWLPLSYHPSSAGILTFAVIYGFVSGGFVSLCSPCVIALVDGRLEDLGVKLGMACLCLALGALVGLPSYGAVHTNPTDFSGLIVFSGTVMAAGSLCLLGTRVTKHGWKLSTNC